MSEDEFQRTLNAALARAVDRFCAETVVPRVRDALSAPYPPASRPGDPPHRRDGLLQAGVSHAARQTTDGAVAEVGSDRAGRPRVPFWLESGTRYMDPRPFMVPEMLRVRSSGLAALYGLVREEMVGR